MHIAGVGERLPRLQIQFRISRSFRPRNLANLGSKIFFGFAERNTPYMCASTDVRGVLSDNNSHGMAKFVH